MPSEPDRFVAHVDPALVQRVLDISEREREPDIEHHGQANDFVAGSEATEKVRFGYGPRLNYRAAMLKNLNLTEPSAAFARRSSLESNTNYP